MENIAYRRKMKSQIKDAYGRIVYTYTAHHKLADRLDKQVKTIKIAQVILTATSAVGFFAIVITNQMLLGWVSGATAALSLGINLYVKEFDYQRQISLHRAAANDLWDVRELYISLLTDFEFISEEEIRESRDCLQKEVSTINRKYPGTDKKSYSDAQKSLQKEEEQTFKEGEVDKLLPRRLRE